MPLFSPNGGTTRGHAIGRLADDRGQFRLKLFEPQYLEMAKLIEHGKRQFGFMEGDMTEVGASGWIVEVLSFAWTADRTMCLVDCMKQRPFRIKRSRLTEDEQGLMRGDLRLLKTRSPKLKAGQAVYHKKWNYRGVVMSADPVCMADPEWAKGYYGTTVLTVPCCHCLTVFGFARLLQKR
jgi:hypothetical protein